jgi:SPFH domain / Band 7 family
VTLLAVLREHDLDSLLRDRESISGLLRGLIDAATEPWGIEVTTAEIKDVELPEQMRRAMAREAESERERRAKVIHARGEFEASEMLGQAASVLEQHPAALQLRTLATLAEISVERNSTIVFPLPFEIMRVFDAMARKIESEITPPPVSPAPPLATIAPPPLPQGPQDAAG